APRLAVETGSCMGDQPVLPRRSTGSIASFEHKSGWLPFHERCMDVLQMMKERALYIVGLADVNPFTRIRDAVNTGGGGRVRPDSSKCKRDGNELVKGHSGTHSVSFRKLTLLVPIRF